MDKKLEQGQAPASGGGLAGKAFRNPYLRYILFGVVIALLPLLAKSGIMPSSFLVNLGGVLIYSIVALGLNLLLGYSGLISLGTAGFMGLGAYLSGYLSDAVGLPFLLTVLIAIMAAAVLGVLVGFVSLRVAGIYLAIATLCVSEILRKTFEELNDFTGGFSGLTANFPTIFGIRLSREATFVLLTVALVLVSGLGGALYMHFIKFSYPAVWVLTLSLNILAVVVIGGLRSIYGTVIGALIVFAVPDLLLKRIPVVGKIDGIAYIFTGVLIILVVMFYPSGVVGIPKDIKRLFKWLTGRKEKKGGADNG